MRRLQLVIVSVLLGWIAPAVSAQSPEPLTEWRQGYETRLQADYGWLSVSGLSFLRPGVNTIGSLHGSDVLLPARLAPLEVGRIVLSDRGIVLHLRAGVRATVDGTPAPAIVRLQPAEEGAAAPRVRIGEVEFHLHRSGERVGIRVRNPQSAVRRAFTGVRWFAPDARYDVVATLERSAAPQTVPVRNILGDAEQYTSPGTLTFTLAGRHLALVPFSVDDGRLWLVFRDASAGRATYGTRFLYAEPLGGNQYRLDFNRTYNPPCAYNPHTTCPTPLDQNILLVEIPAGERLYPGGPTLTAHR